MLALQEVIADLPCGLLLKDVKTPEYGIETIKGRSWEKTSHREKTNSLKVRCNGSKLSQHQVSLAYKKSVYQEEVEEDLCPILILFNCYTINATAKYQGLEVSFCHFVKPGIILINMCFKMHSFMCKALTYV